MGTLAPGMLELGRRVRARREEARLDLAALAQRVRLEPSKLDAFESGRGGLGVAALMRVASELGVPPTSFVHVTAPVVPAALEPSVVLKAPPAAWLTDEDREALVGGLRRARAFTEAGQLIGGPRPADSFEASAAPDKDAHRPGYAAAREARNLLGRPGPLRSVARLLEDRFDILVLRHRFADPRVLGAACRSASARLIAVNMNIAAETTRRFALAHELAHHLLDLGATGVAADEVPERGARAWFGKRPAEKRADAFAAMFLAPEATVADVAGPPRAVTGYDEARSLVEQVRAVVGMGYAATAWHLHNLGYFDQGRAEMLILAEPEVDPIAGLEEDTRFDGLERRVLEAYAREHISRGRARELLGGVDPEALAALP
ncbi:MAG: ImmA/IrrE family metallo-endopeptidase [Anaeromyxobacteraceae bacterium]|nr:ImmA/IrrE family metallo-endopeptidase [Anaeromyxobacteraceae bacterium]